MQVIAGYFQIAQTKRCSKKSLKEAETNFRSNGLTLLIKFKTDSKSAKTIATSLPSVVRSHLSVLIAPILFA